MTREAANRNDSVHALQNRTATDIATCLDRVSMEPNWPSYDMTTSAFILKSTVDTLHRQRSSLMHGPPIELRAYVASFLTGHDLFQLSHVDSTCFALYSRPSMWQSRFGCSKRSYMLRCSVLFEGLPASRLLNHGRRTPHRGDYRQQKRAMAIVRCPRTGASFTSHFGLETSHVSFALQVWFALLGSSASDGEPRVPGGVLIGGQSNEIRRTNWMNNTMRSCPWTPHATCTALW